MNDIHNNENISQEEEFVSPGQEKVNGKATPEQSGPSTGEPREQPGEPTEEAVEIEETEEIEIIEAGEFTVPKKEEEEEEIQELHTKHPRREQIRIKRVDLERNPLKKVYRKAKPHDIEKWQQAIALEHDTMIRSRKIAADLKLNMKIGDVEYQGDKTKAIFYYIADDRVDFRTLIKVLAETFHIRIEMKQIGTRQEAGRIGGIGPCGRKLCCSTFITNFISVSTSAARYQDISLNPQKLAGQCGKLKCCLNYEVDAYVDAQKDFPSTNITLNTGEGLLYHQKTDIFGQMTSYSTDKEGKGIFIQIPVKRVKEIIAMNRKGIIPPKAVEESGNTPTDIKYTDGVGEESLNRFDEKKQKKRHSRQRNNNNRENGNSNTPRNEKNERNGERGGQRPFRNGPRQDQRRDSRPIQRPKPRTDQHSQSKTEQ